MAPESTPPDDETAEYIGAFFRHVRETDRYYELSWWRRLFTRKPRFVDPRDGSGNGS